MIRVCSGCGRYSCSGECYLECEADYPPENEAPVARKPYVPSPEYLAWCAEVDARKALPPLKLEVVDSWTVEIGTDPKTGNPRIAA